MAVIRQSPGCDTTDFRTCSEQINTLSQTKLPQRKSSGEKDKRLFLACVQCHVCFYSFFFFYWILTTYCQVGTPPKEPPLFQSLKHPQTIDLLLEFKQKILLAPHPELEIRNQQRSEHVAAISEHYFLKRRHCKNRGKCFLHLGSWSEYYFPHLPPAP